MWPTSENYVFFKYVGNSCFNAVHSFALLYVKCSLCCPVSVNETTLEDAVTNRRCPDFEELKKKCSSLNLEQKCNVQGQNVLMSATPAGTWEPAGAGGKHGGKE